MQAITTGVKEGKMPGKTAFLVLSAIFLLIFCFTLNAHAAEIEPPVIDQDHLVLWLKFNEGNGSVAVDSSGNGNNGTIYGATWTTGRYGYALSFSGSLNNRVEIGDVSGLAGNLTICAWIKPNVEALRAGGTSYAIVDKSFWYEVEFRIQSYTSDQARLYWYHGNGTNYQGRTLAFIDYSTLEDWTFVCGVRNTTTKTLKGYVNAEIQFSQTYSIDPIEGDYSLEIGIRPPSMSIDYAGLIDEVRVYNRTLTDSEIKSMYEALRLHIKDETNLQAIANANVTIFNSNTSITVPIDNVTRDAVLFHANMSSYGYGQYFISVSANNYYERKLIANINDGQLTELTSYLPPTSANVVYDVFTLNDVTGSFNSTETILQIKKPIGNEIVPVFQSYFDFNDQAATYLILDDYYQLSLITDSQESNFGWLIPDPDGQITIIPSKITIYNYFNEWVGIDTNFDDSTKTITVEYNSTIAISKAKFWVNFSNGTVAYHAEIGNQSTGSFTYTASINDSYLVRLRIEAADGRIYDPFWFVDWSGVQERIPFLTDLPSWAKDAVVTGMLIVFLLIFGNYRSDVSTAMTAGMAALAWWLGWLNTNFTVIVIMAIIAIGAVMTHQRKEVRD